MIKGDIHFYSKYSSQWRRLTSIPLTSRFFFPLSRFHDIFKKKENKEERERVFFLYNIQGSEWNCKFLFIRVFHAHAD